MAWPRPAVNSVFYNFYCSGTARGGRRPCCRLLSYPGTAPSPASAPVLVEKGHSMTRVILVLAGLFEVVWAVGLKYTHGFTRLVPSAVTLAGMLISFWLLSLAMKSLPPGTAYPVWGVHGALGAFWAGIRERQGVG